MLQAVNQVNGRVLWANTHLLFWLSLIPFASGWMGENNFAKVPVAIYGIVLFMNAIAYTILARLLINLHGKDSLLAIAVGKDWKGIASMMVYALGIAASFWNAKVSMVLYAIVATVWFIPDSRIEKKVLPNNDHH